MKGMEAPFLNRKTSLGTFELLRLKSCGIPSTLKKKSTNDKQQMRAGVRSSTPRARRDGHNSPSPYASAGRLEERSHGAARAAAMVEALTKDRHGEQSRKALLDESAQEVKSSSSTGRNTHARTASVKRIRLT
ncbi:hypothetical protein B0H19DRAFT_1343063 [Mycena capillaripes]|nr:hypothetical protein B0H19DRAFT_1343063 [Mycena capillaripes]